MAIDQAHERSTLSVFVDRLAVFMHNAAKEGKRLPERALLFGHKAQKGN